MIKDRIWTLISRKLSGEATTSELIELNDIIKTQTNADLYLQVIEQFWEIPPEKDEEFLEATYHLHLNRLKEKGFDLGADKENNETQSLYFNYTGDSPKKTNRKKFFIAIPVFSLFAFLFFMYFYYTQNTPQAKILPVSNKTSVSEVSTKSGSRTKIKLPDGTSVWLNVSSKLEYDNQHFGEKIREVTLTGEAYFDVVKNKEKPFIIHANKINIKVTGTAFNVKAYPDEKNTETSLIRGSIEVTVKGRKGKIMMKPNDKLIISNGIDENRITKKADSIVENSSLTMGHLTLSKGKKTVEETAWIDNKLVFDNETFDEVALKMERWYGVSITFADDKLKSQRLTGIFEKETVSEALKALQQVSSPVFKYKINNQSINIFK